MSKIKNTALLAACLLSLTACTAETESTDIIDTGISETSVQTEETVSEEQSVTETVTDEENLSVAETAPETQETEVTTEKQTTAQITETPVAETTVSETTTVVVSEPKKEEAAVTMSDGIKRITHAMLEGASESSPANGVVSGYSAYSALMKIYPYTKGATESEITVAVGAFDKERFETEREGMAIETGGLFLIDEDLKLNTTDETGFTRRDLHDDSVVDFVNNFVAEKTHDFIPSIISGPFEKDTRAVVVDALYLNAKWKNPFMMEFTDEGIFYGKSGEQTVEYMTQLDYFVTADNMIRLPYTSGSLVMDIVRDVDDVPAAFENYLKECSKLDDKETVKVDLILPKFESEIDSSITDSFKSLGIESIFSASADITGLSDDIFVSDIRQKAKIRVDEEGTEAAAISMILCGSAAMPEPEVIVDFHVKEPFIYVLKDTQTDTVLFAGYYNDFE